MKDKIFQSITFLDCGETLSENEIVEFETEYHIRLPNAYRQFLMMINGGYPHPKNMICCQFEYQLSIGEYGNKPKDIEQFEVLELLGLTHIGCESQTCIKKLSTAIKYVNVPDSRSFIPIGVATGSNYIYMSISDKYYGNIFLGAYLFGDSTYDDNIPKNDNIMDELALEDLRKIYEEDIIAASFTELLKLLTISTF